MPRRDVPLVTSEYYHVLNRGNASEEIFTCQADYEHFLEVLLYYQCGDFPFKHSLLKKLEFHERLKLVSDLRLKGNFVTEIIAYCFMPNHYHLLLKQRVDNGVFNFIRLSNNSYSRYFNLKYGRRGSLFEGRFKAIRVQTNEQLLHLSRYIHLNPLSSSLVNDFEELTKYPYASISEFLGRVENPICNSEPILSQFSSRESYRKFLEDRVDYQKDLEECKHLFRE